jgi:hypothetical protein
MILDDQRIRQMWKIKYSYFVFTDHFGIICIVLFWQYKQNDADPLKDLEKDYPIVDIEDGRKVELGTTYDQVVSIIGHNEYFKLQQSLYPVYYMWKTSDGLLLQICFENVETICSADTDSIVQK